MVNRKRGENSIYFFHWEPGIDNFCQQVPGIDVFFDREPGIFTKMGQQEPGMSQKKSAGSGEISP